METVLSPKVSRHILSSAPNARRLFQSLRDSGYSNETAIADLVDNSIDGEAARVRIWVYPQEGRLTPQNAQLVVADDGSGMPEKILIEALRLGSEIEKDTGSDLGKYGMGLITASISMARQLVVITKTGEGQLLRGTHDLDEIEQRNEFVAHVDAADSEAKQLWEQFAVDKDHGTVVVLRKCDQLAWQNAASFVGRLKGHLGQVFRAFIAAKSKKNGGFDSFLSVNGQPVYVRDPLFLEQNRDFMTPEVVRSLEKFSTLDADTEIQVENDPHDPTRGTSPVRIKIVTLPDVPSGLAGDLGVTINNAGIYVMRNQREIASALTFGIFSKHSWVTQFRAEVHFPALLDKRVGLNWTKHRVEPDQGLTDIVRRAIGPHVTSERKRRFQKTTTEQKVDHHPYEQLITRKAKLLSFPKVKEVVRIPRGKTKGAVKPKDTDTSRCGTGDVTKKLRDRCEFVERHMTVAGPLWEPDTVGRKLIITFNVDHPLWEKFVVDVQEEENRRTALELLHLFSFCQTAAEQSEFFREEDGDKLVTMRSQISNNMRILLS